MTFSLAAAGVRAVVLDIEGTTTPISFVYEVLFPFARAHVQSFFESNFQSEDVAQVLALLRSEHAADSQQAPFPPDLTSTSSCESISSMVAYVNWLMDQDRKSTGLKSLQGKIWELGYRDGALHSQVFEDVAPALKRWHKTGLTIAIFSSGSVLAQKLLFAHTEKGDLTSFIDGYFDTTTGSKTQPESYNAIASALRIKTKEVLFISDVVQELDPAENSGMRTLLSVRPGNHPQPETHHQIIHSFEEVVR
jgi:enolase-phosphatase E1